MVDHNVYISNFVENGFLKLGQETLQKVFHLGKIEALEKENEMIDLCIEACKAYDKYGHFGDVGLDIVVDANLKIWILEINSNHAKNYPLYISNNSKMRRDIYSKPLEYVKALAGFKKIFLKKSDSKRYQ